MTFDFKIPPDIECPYCGAGQDICHDDGEGYNEDELHQQECSKCEKTFGFYTSISYYYEPKAVACFNGAECIFVECSRYEFNNGNTVVFYRCKICDEDKQELLK